MPDVFVEACDLTKTFNGFRAVDRVSFDIHRGEIFGLLGPNEAGKTTTIRLMATTLPITSGDVRIGGFSVSREPDKVRGLIGVCPQELALYPELSAMDNLVFFGRMSGLGAMRRGARRWRCSTLSACPSGPATAWPSSRAG